LILGDIFLQTQDEDVFFKDYAESHKKLSELGFAPRGSGPAKSDLPTGAVLAQGAFGVAVAAGVVILGYLYEASRKAK
jgi:L-ascorbate peroxidase